MNTDISLALVSEIQKIAPNINAQELDKAITLVISNYHIEYTGTQVVPYEEFPLAVKDYLTSRKIEGLSNSSCKLYYKVLLRFIHEAKCPFNELSPMAIKLWMYGLQKTGLKDTTVKLYVGIVKTFLTWATDNEYLKKDPGKKVPTPRAEIHRKHPLSREELTAVRDACNTTREHVAIELLYSTGCRIGELVTAKISDIDMLHSTISLRNWKSHKDKTGYISETCMYWLKQWLPTCKNDVIVPSRRGGKMLTISGFERMLRDIGERAGLRNRLTPHILRHTLATHIVSNGGSLADAQNILDHKRPETTLIYAEYSNSQLQDVHHRCAA